MGTANQVAPAKAPFLSTALGRALVKIATTALLTAVFTLLKDPSVVAIIAGSGSVATALGIVRDILDQTIPNLPSSS